ncbi:glycosyltransferase family 2 protein [bacterium]|nr:glycosyltransferase family 2 protein [bacterium]MBU1025055.1 glycosyltransferase family 2 protein [bacterium]
MKVSLISLNLNGAPFLADFLDSVSVEITGMPDVELILLDNGSSDNSLSMILNDYPWVRLIQSSRNLGFCGGIHKAVSESTAECLVFLNNDMILEPGFLDSILKPLDDDQTVGAVAGLILNETGMKVDYAGGDINLFGWGFQRCHNMSIAEFEEKHFDNSYPRQFFGCGGSLAMKRSIWEKSGGFDNDYFAFFEDVDLGWRLNLMGLKTVLATKARVLHKHHGTASGMPVFLRTYLLERNALMTVIKNYDDDNLNKILPWALSMANERGLIDSQTDNRAVFKGRWRDDIWGDAKIDRTETLKKAAMTQAKKILRKESAQMAKNPIRNLAIEEVFSNWDSLMKKRQFVHNLRNITDEMIIESMGEKYRSVLGHDREKKMMERFKNHVHL